MAMLAERKRKQKWSLNPRGNDWVQDSNKFGQKMLEKMGWQHGKGLGAKENGITEHVKVSYKNDSKGMGFKESNDQWTEHETNFSALLESLSGEKPNEIKLNSLEKKSQKSRARVHYHKFTRGKDLSRYSEKDLANIFGKKSLKEPSKVEVTDKTSNVTEKNEDNKFLFNGGSMRDYFKKKFPSFGKSNGYIVGDNGVLRKEESDSESNPRPSFSFTSENRDDEEVSYAGFGFQSESVPDTNTETEPKAKSTFISYVSSAKSSEDNSKKKRKVEERDIDNVFSPLKKSRKSKDESNTVKGLANPAFNPLCTPVKVQKHVLDTIEESISEDLSDPEDSMLKYGVTTVQVHASPRIKKNQLSESNAEVEESSMVSIGKKKKSKKSKELENGVVNDIFTDTVDLTLNSSKENEVGTPSFEVKRKESKKKKKQSKLQENGGFENNVDLTGDSFEETKSAYENPSFNSNVDVPCDVQVEENPYEVKPKKSKKKKQENRSVDLTTDDSGISSISEDIPSKSKSKKKKKETTLALENPVFDESLEDTVDLTHIEENPYEVKVKKKTNKGGLDNVNFNESNEDSSIVLQNEENPFEVTRKKKDKKRKNENYAVDNPNFNESLEETAFIDSIENPYEVKPKKKKKKKKDETLAIDNPNFDKNDSENTPEVQRKSKKVTENVSNPSTLTPDIASLDIKQNHTFDIEETDLMLNIIATPIIKRTDHTKLENGLSVTRINSVKRRKSVRFSDVTQEMIIPNNDDLRNISDIENRNELFEINTQVINNSLEEQNISFDMSALDKFSYDAEKLRKKKKLGLDNAGFDKQTQNMEENLDSISKTIDRYQAEIENDINEKKLETITMEDVMIGEVGNPHGEHEKLPEGTKLKFKHANFLARTPFYQLDKTGAKKAYKHLIKGDILVRFKNTNLHEIQGYASKHKNAKNV